MMYAQSQRAPWEGSSQFYMDRRDKRDAAQRETFEDVFARNNMFASMNHIAQHCGGAAGPDGVSPRNMTGPEMGQLAQATSAMIRAGAYTSSEPRWVPIEKPDKPGQYRMLAVSICADRMVAHTLHKTFSPRVEPLFLANSHGFRPGKSPRTLLRDLNSRVTQDGRSFLALDDVEKAFDSVVIDQVMDSLAWAMEQVQFPADESQRRLFIDLFRQVLAIGDPKRQTGIPQGCAVSPLLLNVLLHHRLDTQLASQFGDSYFRFADNLIYAGRNPYRCQQFLDASEKHLDALHLKLKLEHPRIVDLNENVAAVLGFQLSLDEKDSRLKFGMGPTALADLSDELRAVHHHKNPSGRALQVCQGWISSYGPALDMSEGPNGSFRQILSTLRRAGISFPESVLREIQERMTLSYGRWSSCLSK